MKKIFLIAVVLVLASCNKDKSPVTTERTIDTHSYAQADKAIVKHLDLSIAVDFEKQQLSGKASWQIDNISGGNEIIFDQNTLNITKVTLGPDDKPTDFTIGRDVEYHGGPLKVSIDKNTTQVNIYYTTTKDAVALQWLSPAQTADKKHPFLFSQGQSIWSRTWLPCQDSPSIRFTYKAEVSVPKELMATMSATNPTQKNSSGIYNFVQDKPIPSYLITIAVGDLSFNAIDRRTGVYAEHSVIDAAAAEFSELGKMVHAAEQLYGPYRWGRYDVLVLPPSFPYGGMENPNLTFLTPGVIAGDKSLTSLLAHELGHSWSGNLVTNATWDDMWLNEGFTTYVEHRIGEALYGKNEAAMQDVLSRKVLKNNIDELGATHADTRLFAATEGKNPDDLLTDIPYEKGYAFLQTIEQAVGRKRMDAFLRKYFDDHAFQSINTAQFVKYFNENLLKGDKELEAKIRPQEWIFGPGIPDNVTVPVSADFSRIDRIQAEWRQTGIKGLSQRIKSTNERLYFIDNLPEDINNSEMAALDAEFNFTEKGNYIVKRQWFLPAIRHGYTPARPAIEKFMIATSRTGTLQSLYKEMVKTTEGKAWAKQIFAVARPGYHLTTVQSIANIVK